MYSLYNKALFKSKFNELFNLIILDIVAFTIAGFVLFKHLCDKLWYISSDPNPLNDPLNLSSSIFKFILMLIIIYIFVSVFILFCFNKRNEYLFLSHQPTTKDSIAFTKLVLLLCVLIVNLSILFFTIVVFNIKYEVFLNLFSINLLMLSLKILFLILSISLILISFLLALNYFINNGVLAILVSIFLLSYIPIFLVTSSSIIKYTNFSFLHLLSMHIRNFMGKIFYSSTMFYLIQGNVLNIFIIFILGMCGLILCTKILYNNIKLENFNGAFYSKNFLIFLNIIISLLVPLVILSFFNLRSNACIFTLWAVLSIVSMIALSKFSKKVFT